MNRPAHWMLAAAGLLPLGCAGPRQPRPPVSALAAANSPAEAAIRDERLELMQQVWLAETGAAGAEQRPPLPQTPGPLNYPAGWYDGIRFAPRTTADPGLSDPVR